VTAIGGALVTGAWVRITRAKRWRYAWLFGIGAVIVVLARPFEGLLLVVPALIALGLANRTARVWLPIALTGVAGASWLAYDNYRVTGHPLRLPYREYYEQYEIVPPFSFLSLSTPPRTFRHFDLESRARETYERVRSWPYSSTAPWTGSLCCDCIMATSSGCCRWWCSCPFCGAPGGRDLRRFS